MYIDSNALPTFLPSYTSTFLPSYLPTSQPTYRPNSPPTPLLHVPPISLPSRRRRRRHHHHRHLDSVITKRRRAPRGRPIPPKLKKLKKLKSNLKKLKEQKDSKRQNKTKKTQPTLYAPNARPHCRAPYRVCAHRAPTARPLGGRRDPSETSARPRRGRARPAPYMASAPDTLAITPTFLRVPRLSDRAHHNPAARVGPPLGEGAFEYPNTCAGRVYPPESRGGGPSPPQRPTYLAGVGRGDPRPSGR